MSDLNSWDNDKQALPAPVAAQVELLRKLAQALQLEVSRLQAEVAKVKSRG